MKEVIIHIGHGKTGSSYLQSIFALNKKGLLDLDTTYPDYPEISIAIEGKISSGNGGALNIETIENANTKKILFSNEIFFDELQDNEFLVYLSKNYNLKIILYIRNIIEHRISRWSQLVKRNGITEDVDTFLKKDTSIILDRILWWKKNSQIYGYELLIRNYSVHKKNLVKQFFHDAFAFDIKYKELTFPTKSVINRSPTLVGIYFQRFINSIFKTENSSKISDFFINNFPNLRPAEIKISKETYSEVYKKNIKKIDEINIFLPESDKLELGKQEIFVNNF